MKSPDTIASNGRKSRRPRTRGATLLALGAVVLASQPAAARVATRIGPNAHAEIYTLETGQRFLPRGVNYVRLGTGIPGIPPTTVFHNLFCPGTYSSAAASADLQEIRNSGYNVVRVFLTPTCMTADMPRWTLNATVVSYINNFLWNADRVGLKVVLTMDNSLPPGYQPSDTEAPVPPHLGYLNHGLMRAEYVSARARFWRELLVMMEAQAQHITWALLSVDIANEPAFYATPGAGAPFDVMAGTYHDFNLDFNMASPAARQDLADRAFARYVSWIRGDIASVAPGVLVTVGITPPYEVHLAGYNGLNLNVFSPGRSATEYRYPPRLVVAQPWLDYYSIHSYPGGMTGLEYLNRTLASIEYSSLDLLHRPIELGELGASRAVVPTSVAAANLFSEYISLLDQLAFAGYTMWSWDTPGLPEFWNMKDDGGYINGAVAPIQRGYGSGGLGHGYYVVQGGPVMLHNVSSACIYAAREDYYDSTDQTSVAGLLNVLGAGAVPVTTCPLIAPAGPFQLGGTYYYSNGGSAYCAFATWADYTSITGLTTAPSRVLHRLPDMRNDGACHR